jgi:hypothetical protein
MWFETASKSVIYLRPVLGGGRGFNVKLKTDRPVGSDYLRDVYCSDLIIAAERVKWIMTSLVQGDWSLVP